MRNRLVWSGSLAALAVIAGSFGFVQMRAGQAWREMQQRIDGLQHTTAGRDLRRAPLWGEAQSGAAHDHYKRALQLARGMCRDDETALREMMPHSDDAKVAGTGGLLLRWQPVLAELRAGARAGLRALPPRDFSANGAIMNLLDARWLCNVAVLQARADRLAGDGDSAVQWTLDAMQFGADMLRCGVLIEQMIGTALVAIAAKEAWPDAAIQMLDDSSLALLASGLQRLDGALPEQLDFSAELSSMGLTLSRHHGEWSTRTWRHGFSNRWQAAEAFVAVHDTFRSVPDCGGDWHLRQARLTEQGERLAQSTNPLTQTCAPNLQAAEGSYRSVLAQLRLLRMAVELHRGNEPPTLRDPLGNGPLAVTRDGDSVTIRSEGSASRRPIERTVELR